MNPLIELKDRLHQSAMAGTDLLNEDFRLKKIAEQIAPLSAKNPIFKKISERLDELFKADNENRPEKLINAISLVDAVVATQSTYKLDGEIEQLPKSYGLYNDIPYSSIMPVIKALTSTGSGRFEVINELFNEFVDDDKDTLKENYKDTYGFKIASDFRLRNYWIKALDDKYTDICNLVVKILGFVGDYNLVEVLKNSLDIKKDTESMVRKLKVICKIAKEKENDLYKYIFENGSAKMKLAAVDNLKYSVENIDYIISAYKNTKNANIKDALLKSIAEISNKIDVEYFWIDFYKNDKVPQSISLKFKKSENLSNIIVDKTINLLKKYICDCFGFKDKNLSNDYFNFVADKFQSIGNQLYENFSHIKYDFKNDYDYEGFLKEGCISAKVNNAKKYDFFNMGLSLNGCTLDSLINLSNYFANIVCDEAVDIEAFATFSNALSQSIANCFFNEPTADNANRIITLYRIYGKIFTETALAAALFINHDITYYDFINLLECQPNHIAYKGSNELKHLVCAEKFSISDINKKIKLFFEKLNIKNGSLYWYGYDLHIKSLNSSWIKNGDNFELTPKKAYLLLQQNENSTEKQVFIDYIYKIINNIKNKCLTKSANNNVNYERTLVSAILYLKKLEVKTSLELAYMYFDIIVNMNTRYWVHDVIMILLCGNDKKSEKLDFINYAIKTINDKYTNKNNSILTMFLNFKRNIETDEEAFDYDPNAIERISYYFSDIF